MSGVVDLSQFELTTDIEVVRCQPYEPVCACPACATTARWPATADPGGFVRRTCTHCRFTWQQFTNRAFTKGL